MGRNIEIDARRGGGAAHEILFGEVTIEATALRQDSTKTVFPAPTTIGISNGLAVLENVDVSPAGPEPEWAYKMTFRDHMSGKGWSEMVGVPTGTTPVKYPTLPRFTTAIPPETSKAELQNWVATTEAAKNTAVQAAATATAPTDATMADKIGTKGSLTETALSAAIGESSMPGGVAYPGIASDVALKKRTLSPLGSLPAQGREPSTKVWNPALTSVPTPSNWTWAAVAPGEALTIGVVAPQSGKVVIRCEGAGQATLATAGLQWCLFAGNLNGSTSTSPLAGTDQTVIQTNATAGFNTNRRITATWHLTGLTPGTTYFYRLGHRCQTNGVNSQTNAGGEYGPIVLTATPVSGRLTETGATGTVTVSNFAPVGISADDTTFYAANLTTGANQPLAWSTDDGATWTSTTHTFGGIQITKELADGEILVFVGEGSGVNSAIWRSTGWATNKATATFVMVHEAIMPNQSWQGWSIDAWGSTVLAAEYGSKASPSDMARYVYASEDYGQTWNTIFDLADPAHSTGVEAHLHGLAYDPWWDAIWLCTGDGPGNNNTFVSYDHGESWVDLQQPHQFTSIFALPDRIVFVTDRGAPNGVFYIPRTHPDRIVWQIGWTYDEITSVSILGSHMHQSRTRPGAPLLAAIQSGTVLAPGRLWVTYDGVQWREVWNDIGFNAQNHGLRQIYGPSVNGKYLGWVFRRGANAQVADDYRYMLTLTGG